ncbi:hypothetical protein CCR90_12970 [Rhodovulum sulfidophilum]|nr:hypothetical protein [Rhodovulum sulfidophilum]
MRGRQDPGLRALLRPRLRNRTGGRAMRRGLVPGEAEKARNRQGLSAASEKPIFAEAGAQGRLAAGATEGGPNASRD